MVAAATGGACERALWLGILYSLALLACLFSAARAHAANVYVIDTDKTNASFALTKALNDACRACQPVKYMDISGSARKSRELVAELKRLNAETPIDLVITLGEPATKLIAREFPSIPMFHTLTSRRQDGSAAPVMDFAPSPSPELQLKTLLAMAPGAKKIGFIATSESLDPLKEQTQLAAKAIGVQVKYYYVRHTYDVPDGLRKAIQEMDALVFVRDKLVVNNDTANFILRLTLENQIPTLTYTSLLVDKGWLAALTPDPERLGQKIGKAADGFLTTGQTDRLKEDPSLFELHINNASMKQTPSAQASAPSGIRVVLR